MSRLPLLIVVAVLAGCSAHREARDLAGQSAALLSELEAQVEAYNSIGPGQNPLRTTMRENQRDEVTFLEAAAASRQAGWVEGSPPKTFGSLPRKKPEDLVALGETELTPRPAVNLATVETKALKATIAALQGLAEEPDMKERFSFLKDLASELGKALAKKPPQ